MKKALIGLIVGLMVASAGVAGASVARSLSAKRSLPARVKLLEGKVRKLTSQLGATEGRVTSAEGRLTTAEGKLSCLQWVGMTSYGAPPASGYSYTNDGGATYFFTSAVDITESGQTPQLYVIQIPATCASGANAFDRLAVHQAHTARTP